jgi:hypothetical protein
MRVIRLCVTILALALGACAELPQYWKADSPGPAEVRSGASTWLEAVHAVRVDSPEQQQATLDNWEQAFKGNPDINNRMRLALLLATGTESLRDTRRARRLLDGVDPLPEPAGDREMIALLQLWLDEQAQANRKLSILWKQVTAQNRRIEELEQQLQALTTIEQNIQNRDIPVVIENER